MSKKNRKIEALFAAGMNLHIDTSWGLSQFAQYRHECEMIAEDKSGEIVESIKDRRRDGRSFSIDPVSMASVDSESSSTGSIQVLNLSGVMRLQGGMSSRGVNGLVNDLREADANPGVKGAIVQVNSGGGESLSGNALHQAVAQFSKPIVALVDMMGSAAVNGMLKADSIIMNGEGSEAGSIGSYMSIDKRFLEFYNENIVDLYAAGSPGKNQEFRELVKGNSKPMLEYVEQSAAIFRAKVAESRQLNPVSQKTTLEGGMFYAADSVDRGLADSIGDFRSAVAKVNELAGTTDTAPSTGEISVASAEAIEQETQFENALLGIES